MAHWCKVFKANGNGRTPNACERCGRVLAQHENKTRVAVKAVITGGEVLATREFDTGATRDTDDGKLDYEGFLSPEALEEFASYMHKNRVQADGSVRDSDNWQKGIPLDAYMKSLLRHLMEVWIMHRRRGTDRGYDPEHLVEHLCAALFNVQGYLHEMIIHDREWSGDDGEDCD